MGLFLLVLTYLGLHSNMQCNESCVIVKHAEYLSQKLTINGTFMHGIYYSIY